MNHIRQSRGTSCSFVVTGKIKVRQISFETLLSEAAPGLCRSFLGIGPGSRIQDGAEYTNQHQAGN
ncbi:MAG TPA: hypothetical protein VN673_02555 [Clostridia bacterium]|nr:hypothetical protein [Clostridia bacterium]